MLNWSASSALQDVNGDLRETEGRSIRLCPGSQTSKVRFQCRPDTKPDMAAFEQLVGKGIPLSPHHVADVERSVFWLAPNEWLIVLPDINTLAWREKLMKIARDQTHTIVDLSDSLTTIEIYGENSAVLLAEGCGVDMHPTTFSTGQYLSTRLVGLSVMIHRISEECGFRLYVDRSVALHLWQWLEDGLRQFGE